MKTQGKIKSILLAAFAALVLGGCKDGDNPFYAPNETKIMGDIAFSDTICGIPMAIDSSVVPFFHRSVDEYFVVANSGNTKLFSVYDSQSDSLIAQFGTIGHANDEFPSSPANFYFGEYYFRRDKFNIIIISVIIKLISIKSRNNIIISIIIRLICLLYIFKKI